MKNPYDYKLPKLLGISRKETFGRLALLAISLGVVSTCLIILYRKDSHDEAPSQQEISVRGNGARGQLQLLKRNTNATVVDLSYSNAVDEDLFLLSDYNQIKNLNISMTGIKGCGLEFINKSKCYTLRARNLSFTPSGVQQLGRFRHLRELSLSNSRNMEQLDFSLFPNLKRLAIASCQLGSGQLESISRIRSLEWLDIQNAVYPKDEFRFLESSQVQTLHLGQIGFDPIELRTLEGMPSLGTLYLSVSDLGSLRIEELCRAPQLRCLSLASESDSQTSVDVDFSKFPRLEFLCISGANVEASSQAKLLEMESLKEIRVQEGILSRGILRALHAESISVVLE